jgi:hypothetical protein
MGKSDVMVVRRDFREVIICDLQRTKEGSLYLWGNDQVNGAGLLQIAQRDQWERLEDTKGFFGAVYEKGDKVYIFCDRIGIYPLFYCVHRGAVYVSPILANILLALPRQPGPSIDGIVSLLLFGHHLADETIFKDIRRCNAGTTVVLDKKGKRIQQRSWKKKHVYQEGSSVSAGELAGLFVENVRESVSQAQKVLVALSGGFDSRAILGAVMECAEIDRINTVTFGGTDTYDYKIGKLVANTIGVANRSFPITDDIFSDGFLRQRASHYSFSYPALATQPQEMISHWSEELSNTNISLWGVGGDAITGSHLHASDISLKQCNNLEDYARLLIKKRCNVPLKTVSDITHLSGGEIVTIISQLIERSVLDQYDKSWQFLDAWDIFVRGRMEIVSVIPFCVNLWRCPHLSGDYFNLMSTLDYENKIHQRAYRNMLAARFRTLFSLPTRRLRGRSLVLDNWKTLYWTTRWRTSKFKRSLGKLIGQPVPSIGRNYGNEQVFFNSFEGRERLRRAVQLLRDQNILRRDSSDILQACQRDRRIGRILVTLGYAFE